MYINNFSILENTLNKQNKETLSCIYDNRKSFYNKAKIARYQTTTFKGGENKLIIGLYSYNTLVCIIYNDNKKKESRYILNDNINESLLFSNTTLRHLKEFLLQFTFGYTHLLKTKKDIIKYNNNIFTFGGVL